MNLKLRNSKIFIILVLFSLLLSLLTLTSQKIHIIEQDTIQEIMTLDLGISSSRNLLDDGMQEINTSALYRVAALLKNIPNFFYYKFFDKNVHKFEKIYIDIKFKNYEQIMFDRSRALKSGRLHNPVKINAIVKHNNNTYKAKIGLKGDFKDHWSSSKRMSLEVELKNKKSLLGFNKFSMQTPSSRQHPYDYTFQSLIRDAGGLSSVHKFANIFVNGDDWGIMNIEERMSKEFLEKQNRKNSIIIRFSNDKRSLYEKGSKVHYPPYRLSDPLLYIHLYNKKSLKDEYNRKVYSYILENSLHKNNTIFDIDSLSRAFILAQVWGNYHTLGRSNSRYYFNPYTLKLEAITTDQGIWKAIQNYNPGIPYDQYKNILSNKFFLESLPYNLKKVETIVSNASKHLSYLESLFPLDKKKSTKIIKDNMKIILNNKEKHLFSPKMSLSEKSKSNNKGVSIKLSILPTKQQASEFIEHLHIRHYTDGTLEIHNLLPDNVIVKDILYNGNSFINSEIIVPSYLSNPEPVVIKTTYEGIQDDMFLLNTQYQGFNRSINNKITLIKKEIDNPLLLDTSNKFNFINQLDNKKYEIKSGNWLVDKPIIIKGDLHIHPGVNLKFSKDAYIIVKGSMTAIGDSSNLITLKSIQKSWKGIYVLNADKKSHLKNVIISNLSALEDGLLKLTGGITFYKSDVDFENVKINNVTAEDAINIVESSFTLNSVFIDNTLSDGLDLDFSKGSILHSELSNIGGDALDFSGSKVTLENTKANNVKDKAVSAGERSDLNINNSYFNNIGVGVVSKDGSLVNISNTRIFDYKLYAAMTYLKKDFYDVPEMSINNCFISAGSQFIRQKGTNMVVDNIEIPESEINVEDLYKTDVMAK